MPSVITQEIHIIKRIFGENVIDSMISTIKNAIKDAPVDIKNVEIPSALKLFEDAMYDDYDVKRMVEFKQYGSLYICKVIDLTSAKSYKWLAYSLFDILETYNDGNRQKTDNVQYIKLFENEKDCTFTVSAVEAPKNYNTNTCVYDDEKALNEIGKYKVSFRSIDSGDEVTVDVICNPHLLQVSNPYVNLDFENLFDNEFIYGCYNLIVDGVTYPVRFNSSETPKILDIIKGSEIYLFKEESGESIRSISYRDELYESEQSFSVIDAKSEIKDIVILFKRKISVNVIDINGTRILNYFEGEKTYNDICLDIMGEMEFPSDMPPHTIVFTVTDSNNEPKEFANEEIISENITINVSVRLEDE